MKCFYKTLPLLAAAWVTTVAYTLAADTVLIEPHNLTIDRGLRREQADAEILAARRYDSSGIQGTKH